MTSEKIQRLIYALDEALKTGDHAKEYTAAKVLIRETGISDGLTPCQIAAGIVYELEREIEAKEAKKNGTAEKRNIVEKMLKSVKYLDQDITNSAHMVDGFQCVTDLIVLFAFSSPVSVPMPAEESPETVNSFRRFLSQLEDKGEPVNLPDVANLAQKVKAWQAVNPKQTALGHKNVPLWYFPDQNLPVDATILLDVLRAIPSAKCERITFSMYKFTGTDGSGALLCGVRSKKKPEEDRANINR